MLFKVQAGDFFFGGNAQADGRLDGLKHDEGRNGYIKDDRCYAFELHEEEVRVAAVKPAFLFCQQPGQHGSQSAADAMYGNGADGIVDLYLLVNEFNRIHNNGPGNQTDQEGTGHGYQVAACGNAYQACQGAVQGHGNIGLPVPDPGQEHGGAGSDGRGHVGGYENMRGGQDCFVSGHADGGAAVEAEPGKPEDEHAQRSQREAVAGNGVDGTVFIVFADTGSQQPGADTGAHAAHHMYGGRAGKVVEAHLCQPAASPDPVAGNRVDNQADSNAVNAVR